MANFNFNKVMLGGRLTADPELKQTQSGIPVASFSIAVNRRFGSRDGNQPQADFFNVTAWRATAEFVSRYFKKGSSIFVVGTIQNRSWTDPQGVKHYATDIVADEVSFVSSAAQGGVAPQAGGVTYTPDAYGAPTFNNTGSATFEELPSDGDLPF